MDDFDQYKNYSITSLLNMAKKTVDSDNKRYIEYTIQNRLDRKPLIELQKIILGTKDIYYRYLVQEVFVEVAEDKKGIIEINTISQVINTFSYYHLYLLAKSAKDISIRKLAKKRYLELLEQNEKINTKERLKKRIFIKGGKNDKY